MLFFKVNGDNIYENLFLKIKKKIERIKRGLNCLILF